MCAFEINLFSRKQEFYRFSTDDFALLEIGIGNYTISSIANFFSVDETSFAAKKPLNEDIKEFFSNDSAQSIIEDITGTNALDSMEIMAYDEDSKKYTLKTGFNKIKEINSTKFKSDKYKEPVENNLKDFLTKWNDIQTGIETNNLVISGYKLIANRIQTSLSGCITFQADLKILGTDRKSPIKLFLLEKRDSDSSRTIAFNGSPFISAIPQTAEGMRYGYTNTLNAGVGNYASPSSNENSPSDKVAGQLRTVWDPATKTWESGTQQILARLIDSIDGAKIPEATGSALLNLTYDECYDVDPSENPIMGKASKGRALVISTEDGNPNQIGPNFRGGCGNNTKKSIIKVVNRSQRTYKEGTLVVCSLINGEWIIVNGEGDKVSSQKSLSFGHFEYQQYILPANLLFTSPMDAKVLSPDAWVSKIRDDFYVQSLGTEELILNLLAKTIPEDIEDPVTFLINAFKDKALTTDIFNNAHINSMIDGTNAIYFLKTNYAFSYNPPSNEHQWGVPKNALAMSNRIYNLGLPTVLSQSDPIDQLEIPLFWGILFPDGYQAAGASKFLAKTSLGLKSKKVFAEDPNVREFSAGVTASLPPMSNQEILQMFYENDIDIQVNPIDLVRQTGGWYKIPEINTHREKPISVLNYIGSDIESFKDRLINGVYGLEPVNPRKLQFTPLSIEALYSNSILNYSDGTTNSNFNFSTIKAGISYLATTLNSTMVDGNKSLIDYNKFLFGNPIPKYPDSEFPGNIHNFQDLAFSNAFFGNTSALLTRHPPPLGVVNGNTIIPPFPPSNTNNSRRSPVMPIITVKSTIRTNTQALTFTVPQMFGNPQKQTVSPGQGPTVTVLPIGGGLAWNTPGTPVQINSSPQWGDPLRKDDIDSFGTDSLHVRVFEHWPENQTIFLGYIYTPLHFNPDVKNNKAKYTYDSTQKTIIKTDILDGDGQPISNISSVDFKQPTKINGGLFSIGEIVTSDNLAPVSKWEYSTIRRGQLLSGGGFAYLKNIFYISSVSIKNGGKDYKPNDEFILPDGSTFKVSVGDSGKITGISNFISNFDEQHMIKDVSKYQEFTSLTVQPDYLGDSGSGASFNLTIKVGTTVGYDRPPKEVVKKTRLTSPSNGGLNMIQNTNVVTVGFSNTNKKDFDIFYFYNNDPTAYSIGGVLYNNTYAHYVICEVNPA